MADQPTKRRKRKAARAVGVVHRYERDGHEVLTWFLPGDRVVRFDDDGQRMGVRIVAEIVPEEYCVVLDDGSRWGVDYVGEWCPRVWSDDGKRWIYKWDRHTKASIWTMTEGDPDWDPEIDEYEGDDDG